MQTLSLQQNKIVELPSNVFLDLGEVNEIDLSDNMIKEVSLMLRRKTGIVKQNLKYKILCAQIFSENFYGLNALKKLNLASNYLTRITNGTFEALVGLDRLSLHGNILESLEPNAFAGLANLTWLLLGNNVLSELDAELFSPVPNLTRLYVTYSKFKLQKHKR